MASKRIMNHPILGDLTNQKEIQFTFDNQSYTAYEGDTIASALLAHGVRTLRHHEFSNTPRGIYCNIGHCFECRVVVNDDPNIRACMTPVTDGMKVKSSQAVASPLDPSNPEPLPKTYADFEKLGGHSND